MCERLSELRRAVCSYASGFDADVISSDDASRAMREAAAIENAAATLKALAARRVAATSGWKRAGDRSPAHHLAREAGTSIAQAAEALETARRLAEMPALSGAARAGELSPRQAAVIADAALPPPGPRGAW